MIESEELIEHLDSHNARDHTKSIIVAAISALPVIGGPITSLLNDYLPDRKRDRIVQFLNELSESLSAVEDEINENYVESEEFAYLFEQTFLSVSKNYQREKLEAFKSILVNSCINNELENSQKEYFLSIAQKLEPIHFHILSLFYNPETFADRYSVEVGDNFNLGNLGTIVMAMLQQFNYEREMVSAAISELDNYMFFNDLSNSLSAMVSHGGAAQLEGRLTNFGRDFCDFIISGF